jgi:putative flippase GtrA
VRAAERSREGIVTFLVATQAKVAHFSRFTAIGAAGLVVNQGLFWVLASEAHVNYLVAAVLATVGSTTFNFAGIESWVFRGRSRPGGAGVARRFVAYAGVNGGSLLLRLPALALVTFALHGNYFWANLITLAALTVVRFALSDRLIWPGGQAIRVEAQ